MYIAHAPNPFHCFILQVFLIEMQYKKNIINMIFELLFNFVMVFKYYHGFFIILKIYFSIIMCLAWQKKLKLLKNVE
jgi:hypothetical protein